MFQALTRHKRDAVEEKEVGRGCPHSEVEALTHKFRFFGPCRISVAALSSPAEISRVPESCLEISAGGWLQGATKVETHLVEVEHTRGERTVWLNPNQ